jgi:hypothetical protein
MQIHNVKFIPASDKNNNQFIGMKIVNNEVFFYYPETYEFDFSDSKRIRNSIFSILNSIKLGKTLNNDKGSLYKNLGDDSSFPIHSYLWIINDYIKYGRYENIEKIVQNGYIGKINWKKTLNLQPVISENNLIFTKIISERNNHIDNLLSEIYDFCVKRAIDSIGWLYNIKYSSDGVSFAKKFNKKLYLSSLNDELIKAFDDSKKIRLNKMKSIVQGLDNNLLKTNEISYGVDSYEFVFEKMIDIIFSKVNEKEKRSFNPTAFWELVNPEEVVKSSNLRPDTIIIKDNKVYVLDAKYYRYGFTFNHLDLPNTSSIQKQITYGEYIKFLKAKKYDDIYSAFVMPYNKSNNPKKAEFHNNLEFIGVSKASWFDDNDKEKNRRIVGVLMDTKFLIDNWNKKNEFHYESIIKLIETNLNKYFNNI